MIVAGINKEKTEDGMKLNDGGCCIIYENQIIAIAEERITRKKYASGFKNSLEYCLNAFDIKLNDVDLFVVSSCCEKNTLKGFSIEGVSNDRIVLCPSHHYSHATSAFYTSQFNNAIVIVVDNEGNVLDNNDTKPFYQCKMEHMSYYIANNNGIRLLETDDVPTDRVGIGDAYRYFTHYLGFPSYEYAGKVMGLASYGNPDVYKDLHIFGFEEGHISCSIENNYFDCNKALIHYFSSFKNKEFPLPRSPIEEIRQEHADLAYWIQRETEDILIKKIDYLVKKTGIRNICFSGGVALNSVANGRILRECDIDGLYVFPAAGDNGQCIGNAIYGYNMLDGKPKHFNINYAYLGREYSKNEIDSAVDACRNTDICSVKKHMDRNKRLMHISQLISEGKYVGFFNGKSEIGPRALGHRSIFANPCLKSTKNELNRRIKFRESFRPFAPMVLEENKSDYFDLSVNSPYMLLVARVLKPDLIPSVTHIDGSARIQTVSKVQDEDVYQIIKGFSEITGVPVILNTSFNIAGQPIVETPLDAVNCFMNTNLDALAIGDYIICKDKDSVKEIDPIDMFVCSLGENLDGCDKGEIL